ncbi:MAG: hypothetical protein A2X13_01405 [Bacteroidetes bacterium GWC2_33_15]|nr:MAG: hypothetical protein A2X10_08220 [Bacteroidetes bacterium GWA2_33_15]OFX52141.1 MAG: hypothetical protein A2X13_01405 [Bacteroidetes bacterium GWC2_33_15]OFX64295.1 MAG: hypothetical protein A2X15_12225 [Bacteroidetes bacterium GWB2_32_14]OFX67700.1 MAG: hypothetical protein A2X14_06050 [Bacteroidetes bacterium GWD2_33_33]HAN19308.1 hypothetical protein [Bacteroidales bacterium]
MKKILKYLAIFTASILVFTACNDEELDWNKIEFQAAPAFADAVSITGIQDSSFVLNLEPASAEGYIFYIVQASSKDDITDPIYIVEKGEKEKVEDMDVISVTISNLAQYTQYEVFALQTNAQGVPSAINTTTATTIDNWAPTITSFSPAKGSENVSITADFVITFSEPVTYVSGKTIRLFSDFASYDETIAEENIIVEGNVVTIIHSEWPYEDYINLEMDEGAFVDGTDHPSAAIVYYPATPNYWIYTQSHVDFTNLVGHFYVASENEIGFGNGERGGYWVDIERTGEYEITIYNLRFSGAELILTLNPDGNTIVVADQWTGLVHTSTGQNIMASDTDPYDIGVDYVPGSFDPATGELIFYTHYYIAAGFFGFYTYDLKLAEIPAGIETGPTNIDFTYNQK